MRRNVMMSALAGTLALTAVSQADAQHAGAHQGPRGMRGADPIQRLLRMETELGLSSTQVTQLRQIQTQLRATNQPLHEQLHAAAAERGEGGERAALREMSPEERRAAMRQRREARQRERAEMTPEQREAMQAEREARMREMRPVMEQIRANARAAMEQANSVLTAEQRATVQARREARAERIRDRAGHREARHPGGQHHRSNR